VAERQLGEQRQGGTDQTTSFPGATSVSQRVMDPGLAVARMLAARVPGERGHPSSWANLKVTWPVSNSRGGPPLLPGFPPATCPRWVELKQRPAPASGDQPLPAHGRRQLVQADQEAIRLADAPPAVRAEGQARSVLRSAAARPCGCSLHTPRCHGIASPEGREIAAARKRPSGLRAGSPPPGLSRPARDFSQLPVALDLANADAPARRPGE